MIDFRLDARTNVPPYLQLVDQVRQALRMGLLEAGDQLPTVREVAESIAINPNTVLKAYRELEHERLVEGRPGPRHVRDPLVSRTVAREPRAAPARPASVWLRRAKEGRHGSGRHRRALRDHASHVRSRGCGVTTRARGERARQAIRPDMGAPRLLAVAPAGPRRRAGRAERRREDDPAEAGGWPAPTERGARPRRSARCRATTSQRSAGSGSSGRTRRCTRDFTVADLLTMGRKLNAQWDTTGAVDRLSQLGIPLDRAAGRLSGGQRAQVALTLALAKQPDLLVLDEPVASLDPLARRDFLAALMGSVAERGLTVILSSHLIADLEHRCDYLIVLSDSRVQVLGPVDDCSPATRR